MQSQPPILPKFHTVAPLHKQSMTPSSYMRAVVPGLHRSRVAHETIMTSIHANCSMLCSRPIISACRHTARPGSLTLPMSWYAWQGPSSTPQANSPRQSMQARRPAQASPPQQPLSSRLGPQSGTHRRHPQTSAADQVRPAAPCHTCLHMCCMIPFPGRPVMLFPGVTQVVGCLGGSCQAQTGNPPGHAANACSGMCSNIIQSRRQGEAHCKHMPLVVYFPTLPPLPLTSWLKLKGSCVNHDLLLNHT